MTLADYLRKHDLRFSEFARLISSSRQNVSRWASGAVLPRPSEMAKIAVATKGRVTANDFYSATRLKSHAQPERASA